MLKASEERLAAQSHALTTLTAQHAVPQGSFEERLRTHPRAVGRHAESGAPVAVAPGRGRRQHPLRGSLLPGAGRVHAAAAS